MIKNLAGYTIRRATLADTADIVRLRVAMQQEYHPEGELSLEYIKATASSFSEMLENDSYCGWLGIPEGETRPVAVAGYIILRHPPKPEQLQQDRAFVISVYTEPEHRQHGLARALMQNIVEQAREAGLRRLELRSSEMARSLYFKLGFKPQEVLMLELQS